MLLRLLLPFLTPQYYKERKTLTRSFIDSIVSLIKKVSINEAILAVFFGGFKKAQERSLQDDFSKHIGKKTLT